jgi:hypothetical protein
MWQNKRNAHRVMKERAEREKYDCERAPDAKKRSACEL